MLMNIEIVKKQEAEFECLKNAVSVIRNYCTEHDCGSCPFGYDAGKACALVCIPEQWELSSECVAKSECSVSNNTATHTATWLTQFMSDISGWDNSLTAGYDPVAGHYCSNCKHETFISDVGDEILSPYCPNCGAKMNNKI